MLRLHLTAGLCLILASLASSQMLLCYYDSKASKREDQGMFNIDDIDPDLCTHVVYAHADIINNSITPSTADRARYLEFNDLKKRNPDLKTILAVCDQKSNQTIFNQTMSVKENRDQFIQTAVTTLRDCGFDGLSLDCFSESSHGQQYSKTQFTKLCKELKSSFEEEGTGTKDALILTASLSANKAIIHARYEVAEIAECLDFMIIQTYNYHGPWENKTGHPSPLYPLPTDVGDAALKNVDASINNLLTLGAPAEKIILGVSLYGRAFTLSSNSRDIGAPASGPGEEGCFTGRAGFWGFYEVCIYLEGVTTQMIPEQQVPYAVIYNQWVGYENEESLNHKVAYLIGRSLGGVAVMSLDLDDFDAQFCDKGKNPMISHLRTLLLTATTHPPNPANASGKSCDGNTRYFVDRNNPNKFVQCDGTTPHYHSCPFGMVFSESSNVCVTPPTTNTSPSTTTPPTTTTTPPTTTSQTTTTTTPPTTTTTPPTTTTPTTTTTSPPTTPTPTTTTTTPPTTTTTTPPTTTTTTPPTTTSQTTSTTTLPTTSSPPTTTTTLPTTTSPTTTTTTPQTTTTSPLTATKPPPKPAEVHAKSCDGNTSPTTTTTSPPTTTTSPTTTTTSPTTTTTSPTTTTTSPPTTTTSPTTTTTPPPNPAKVSGKSCDGNTEYFVDPVDPNKFFHCEGTIAHHKTCGAGLVFKESINVCDHP